MGRRERKKEEMRKRILDIAMLQFERNGFDAVTMEAIADQADIAKATLYSYYPVKETMLAEWMQHHTRDLAQSAERLMRQKRKTRTRIKALFDLIGELVVKNRSLVEHYILFRLSSKERFYGDPTLRSGIAIVLQQVLSQGQVNGEIRSDFPVEELTAHLESLFLSTLMVWFATGTNTDLGQRLDRMLDLFFAGTGGHDEH